jgi:hypothetical protein
MELPILIELNNLFHNSQSNESLKEGYACFTSNFFSGVGAFCFCDDLEEWKDLYPAIIFIEALIEQNYKIYEPEDLEGLKDIYLKYQKVSWNNEDFDSFCSDVNEFVLSYNIDFLGKTTKLLEKETKSSFIERLHKEFNAEPNENEINFLLFLDGYTS